MKNPRLKYLANTTFEALRSSVAANLDRYISGDFKDLMTDGEWGVELRLEADLSPLAALDPSRTPEAEIQNSLLVGDALRGLTPVLAYEEGIWVRLTHVECLKYSRERWLSGNNNEVKLVAAIHDHFFADKRDRRRDDNALSRLWWNWYIAGMISPHDKRAALEVILQRADYRSNLIERSLTGSRLPLSAGVVRAAKVHPSIMATEASFRSFMKVVNKRGSGIVFEALSESEIDHFMQDCVRRAASFDPLVDVA